VSKDLSSFDSFLNACKSQWEEGGRRYAYSKNKESTDIITEIVGNEWIGGNIAKYVYEIWNAKRQNELLPEVDFFKIAVYAFIWWIKEFKQEYTTVEAKKKYWSEFVENVRYCKSDFFVVKDDFIDIVSYLVNIERNDETLYFTLAMDAYMWWIQEQENLTDRDKGEEFEK